MTEVFAMILATAIVIIAVLHVAAFLTIVVAGIASVFLGEWRR